MMYLLVKRFLRRQSSYDTVVDLACGRMSFARRIPHQRYIGVDIDNGLLREGLDANPEATAICARIEDLDPEVRGDLVLCLECLGMNREFDNSNTLTCVDKMIEVTEAGGRLVFNAGQLGRAYFPEIEARLRTAFAEVRVFRYGRFNQHRPYRTAMRLAHAMTVLPILARDERRSPRRLFLCEGRLATSNR